MVTAAEEAQRTTAGLECLEPTLNGARIELDYVGTGHDGTLTRFTETVELPGSLEHVDDAVVRPVLRLLSLAASLSYFKAFAPGTISVPGGLTTVERTFLREVTRHGLGEFAYVNDLPAVFETPIDAPAAAPVAQPWVDEATPRKVLVPVGGGKDSVVSIEALREAGYEVGLFSVNSYAPIEATARVAQLPLHTARRRLDPELFRLNAEGAPNGHVPVTAVNSLVGLLTALALGFDTVAFSNEASASFGNIDWHGVEVNHQWSKGLEFERLLRGSLPAGAPRYVSLLRPVTELRIARRFATRTAYHQVFTSCNRAFKLTEADRTSWCGECPKCRFVFLCLSPFMPRADLEAVFGGRDLFAEALDHADRYAGFLELLGKEGLVKPLECVGEPDECRVALSLVTEKPDWAGHPFLAEPEVVALHAAPGDAEAVLAFREGEHALTPDLEDVARAV
ncbi:hypothetical protein [Nocardioides bruguierae]|uniref:hypothetical protein n=1 Tax=Nocardioides bruguierae TaxID=2945102 RepID=UPI00202244AC|nr:hypothetical protein [Nocardioides bruguierae]MCL8024890.1 hypothetical protein [Nocardioides bruguierae]